MASCPTEVQPAASTGRDLPIRTVQTATSHQGILRAASARRARGLVRDRRSALVLAGIVLLAVNLRGAISVVPPLLGGITADLRLTPALIGVLGALPTLSFAVAGLLGARFLRRTAAERIAVGVLAVTAAGELTRPWLDSATGFLVLTAVTLLGMGVGNVAISALVKAWFPDRIGGLTAIYVTVITLGTAVPALIAVPIAEANPGLGWRLSLAAWAGVALAGLPIWLVVSRRPRAIPAARRKPGADADAAAAPATTSPRLALHRSRIAWGVTAVFAGCALNIYAMITWLPVRLLDAGASAAQAGLQLAVFTGVGVLPSLLLPVIATRIRRQGLLVAACAAAFVAGFAGILLAPMTLTTLWVAVAGLGGGAFPLALTLVGLRSASTATAGQLSGFVQGLGYTAAATGPPVVGLLHEATGGWTASFGFLALPVLLMLVGAWWCAPHRTVDDDLRSTHRPTSPDTLDR
jgi:CP family cyanate transporter-like MFS transporter